MSDAESVVLDALLGPLAEALGQASLPLHILLESRFGELNDNQLEMIEAARQSVDEADQLVRLARRVREPAEPHAPAAGLGQRPLDLLRAPVALASARGEAKAVTVDMDVSLDLPRVLGDRAHLEEVLSLVLADCVARAVRGTVVRILAEAAAGGVLISIRHDAVTRAGSLDLLLARRLLGAESGELSEEGGITSIGLRAAPSRTLD